MPDAIAIVELLKDRARAAAEKRITNDRKAVILALSEEENEILKAFGAWNEGRSFTLAIPRHQKITFELARPQRWAVLNLAGDVVARFETLDEALLAAQK